MTTRHGSLHMSTTASHESLRVQRTPYRPLHNYVNDRDPKDDVVHITSYGAQHRTRTALPCLLNITYRKERRGTLTAYNVCMRSCTHGSLHMSRTTRRFTLCMKDDATRIASVESRSLLDARPTRFWSGATLTTPYKVFDHRVCILATTRLPVMSSIIIVHFELLTPPRYGCDAWKTHTKKNGVTYGNTGQRTARHGH